jgi:hypothetical protein
MAQKNSQTYNIELINSKEIYDYCLLNQIVDINGFIQKCFKKGFDIEKYGLLGNGTSTVEKIVEVIKEVPGPTVEVIKYVDREVIKEVPVEKEIVKEIPVEKIVSKIEYIYDKNDEELSLKIQELELEKQKFSTKLKEYEEQIQKFSTITGKTENNVQNNQDDKLKLLQGTLLSLKKQLSLKDEEIKEKENIIKQLESLKVGPNGAVFLKSSDITKNL